MQNSHFNFHRLSKVKAFINITVLAQGGIQTKDPLCRQEQLYHLSHQSYSQIRVMKPFILERVEDQYFIRGSSFPFLECTRHRKLFEAKLSYPNTFYISLSNFFSQ